MNDEAKIDELELDPELCRSVTLSILKGQLADGKIRLDSKIPLINKRELHRVAKSIAKNENIEFSMIIDHRNTLLQMARTALSENDFDLSSVYFATHFEHSLNNIISVLLNRKKIDQKHIVQIIRSTSLKDKATWLMFLLCGEEVSVEFFKKIEAIAEIRNSYIHYKWKPDDDKYIERQKEALISIEEAVSYLEKMEERIVYFGKSKLLEKYFYELYD